MCDWCIMSLAERRRRQGGRKGEDARGGGKRDGGRERGRRQRGGGDFHAESSCSCVQRNPQSREKLPRSSSPLLSLLLVLSSSTWTLMR
eukprot:763769-Hanusia_phi.AAC.2